MVFVVHNKNQSFQVKKKKTQMSKAPAKQLAMFLLNICLLDLESYKKLGLWSQSWRLSDWNSGSRQTAAGKNLAI